MDDLEISVEDTKKLMKNGKIVLLDVREQNERNTANIKGSIFIPIGQLPGRTNELNKSDSIITYCHHGVRSYVAAEILLSKGFKNVKSMAGGINAWSREINPDVPVYY